jgi:hypothetical protein
MTGNDHHQSVKPPSIGFAILFLGIAMALLAGSLFIALY